MYAGQIVEQADVFQLFDRPMHPYTQGLLASIPKATEKRTTRRLPSISGIVPDLAKLPGGCRFSPRCAHVMPICRQQEPPLAELGEGRRSRCWLHETEDTIRRAEAS
jgi:peptide/nickel transport system ATP-binding protein